MNGSNDLHDEPVNSDISQQNKNGNIRNIAPSTHSISTSPSNKSNGNLRITENPQVIN